MKLLLDECLPRKLSIICRAMYATPFLKRVGQGRRTASYCVWPRNLVFESF